MGRFFTIKTNHQNPKELFQQVIQTPEQQFFVQKLLGYSFVIEYKTGASNQAADALSRKEEESIMASAMLLLSKPMSSIIQHLREENCSLSELKELHVKWAARSLSSAYQVKDGVLYFKDRFYIGTDSSLKGPLLEEFHASHVAGHGGVKNTLIRLSHLFFWPRM